jgi:hypothetical protein
MAEAKSTPKRHEYEVWRDYTFAQVLATLQIPYDRVFTIESYLGYLLIRSTDHNERPVIGRYRLGENGLFSPFYPRSFKRERKIILAKELFQVAHLQVIADFFDEPATVIRRYLDQPSPTLDKQHDSKERNRRTRSVPYRSDFPQARSGDRSERSRK